MKDRLINKGLITSLLGVGVLIFCGVLIYQEQTSKLATTNNVTYRIKINTSNTLSGAVQVASFTTNTTLSYAPINRTFTLVGGNLIGNFGNAVNDLANTAGAISSTPYTTTNTLYVFFTIQLGNIGDSATIGLTNITN